MFHSWMQCSHSTHHFSIVVDPLWLSLLIKGKYVCAMWILWIVSGHFLFLQICHTLLLMVFVLNLLCFCFSFSVAYGNQKSTATRFWTVAGYLLRLPIDTEDLLLLTDIQEEDPIFMEILEYQNLDIFHVCSSSWYLPDCDLSLYSIVAVDSFEQGNMGWAEELEK